MACSTSKMKGRKNSAGDSKSSQLSNGSIMSNEASKSQCETSDSNSDISSSSERRIMRRSSLICSSGKDKFTYDSEHADVPVRGIHIERPGGGKGRHRAKISASSEEGDNSASAVVKRDSVVHPGGTSVTKSILVNGRYQNPWPTWQAPTFTSFLRYGLAKSKSNIPSKQELDLALPIVAPNLAAIASPPEIGIRVTWLGHSTLLLQFDGISFLTDPIFSDRASPSQVVGPKRYRDPPCSVQELPEIQAVVISHAHHDHLDLNSVTLLNNRFGIDLRWFVPMGLKTWMNDIGCENVVELDWWEESFVPEVSDVSFIFTPAQHWSKRTLADDNKVLWGSWTVLGPNSRFHFVGDTAYCGAFRQIGNRYGPFDLVAIPIGAYEPRFFHKIHHCNPEEAVQIHIDIHSRLSIGVHWGTFPFGHEYYLDPPRKVRESMEKHNLPIETFITLKHGESRLVRTLAQSPKVPQGK